MRLSFLEPCIFLVPFIVDRYIVLLTVHFTVGFLLEFHVQRLHRCSVLQKQGRQRVCELNVFQPDPQSPRFRGLLQDFWHSFQGRPLARSVMGDGGSWTMIDG